MNSKGMCRNVIEAVDEALDVFTPRAKYDLFKVEEKPKKYITHKLTGY